MEDGEGADEGEESDHDEQAQAASAPGVGVEAANGAAPAATAEHTEDHTDRYQPAG